MFNMFGDIINIEISDTADLSSISEMRLVDLYCKHMIKVNFFDKEAKSNRLLRASRAVGYDYCEWGTHNGHRNNVSYHIDIIEKMEKEGYNHAIRVVVCKYPFSDKAIVLTDNLHSTVKYIREYGKEVKLKDIPFYVVDLSLISNPVVSAVDMKVLRPNLSAIVGAVSSAYFRYEMSNSKDLIDVGYLVGDLLDDISDLYTYQNTALWCAKE